MIVMNETTVLQDTILFNESLFYNIQYGRPDAKYTEVIEAAKLARIHETITRMPQGYDTMVGERGLKLSGMYIYHLRVCVRVRVCVCASECCK